MVNKIVPCKPASQNTPVSRGVRILIQTETLSDDSKVHNVIFGTLTLHAVTEGDAANLAHKIRDAILAHSVDDCTIGYWEG